MLQKCLQYVTAPGSMIPPVEQGGAIGGCMKMCSDAIAEKCKKDPNACLGGDANDT